MEKIALAGNETADQAEKSGGAIETQARTAKELSAMAEELLSIAGTMENHIKRFRF